MGGQFSEKRLRRDESNLSISNTNQSPSLLKDNSQNRLTGIGGGIQETDTYLDADKQYMNYLQEQ